MDQDVAALIAPGIRPDWLEPPDLAVAREAQIALAARVVREDAHPPVRLLAGVDISSQRFDPEGRIWASVVVLDWPGLAVVARASAMARATIPYIPGYLGFREVPALLAAWARLAVKPDLVLVDGHGIAHPRGFGIATHLGVVLDLPTIGVAKSPLVGRPEAPLGEEPGAAQPLLWKGRRLGTVLRTKRRSNPLYLSTGHRVSEAGAVRWVRDCLRGYRLPEPTRQAHLAANEVRRAALAGSLPAPPAGPAG
ncbi:deoxyribonuclease V [Paracraurococcus ruber]|uniref:Endonuclease V n=1 Tax=Paracraurococcus ruber TaxID=77675 RepID=A0ABS1CS88_9PROT|nr:deoxyribonuclease V [Paracraurococcus ruber]MBK1657327.1 endonuclease V [Paracraurococcus ruber]TDG33997.1 deoxyribonuclease V [Paracraurococcus ruber]